MKKLLWACAVVLPLLALPTEAKAFDLGNWQVDTGAKVWFNVRYAGRGYGAGAGGYGLGFGTPQAGPWYLYWPYEAHFQVPAPGVSPYFPAPMTLPPGFGQPPPAPMPPATQGYRAPMPYAGPQPAGYFYPGR